MDSSLSINSNLGSLNDFIIQAYRCAKGTVVSVCLALDCTAKAPVIIHRALVALVESGNAAINCIHVNPAFPGELEHAIKHTSHLMLVTTEQSLFNQYMRSHFVLLLDPSNASVLNSNAETYFYHSLEEKLPANPAESVLPLSTRTFMTSGSTRFMPGLFKFMFREHNFYPDDVSHLLPSPSNTIENTPKGLCSIDFMWAAKLLSPEQEKVDSICVANTFPMNFDAALSTVATFEAIETISKSMQQTKMHTYRQFSSKEISETPQTLTNFVIQKIIQQSSALKINKPLPLLALFISPHKLKTMVNHLAAYAKENNEFLSQCATFFSTIFTTGSECDAITVHTLFDLCPFLVMINAYGPTEMVYGIPPKAYLNIKTVTSLFSISTSHNDEYSEFLNYTASPSIWPHSAVKTKQGEWAFNLPSAPSLTEIKPFPYKSLFLNTVFNLVPPNRPFHSVKKGNSLNSTLSSSRNQLDNLFELIISIDPNAFTDQERILRSAPLSFETGDIFHFTPRGILVWMECTKYVKGPNQDKIVIKSYAELLINSLYTAGLTYGIQTDNTKIFCAPTLGQGLITFIIEDINNKLTQKVIDKFLSIIRQNAIPCPEEMYILPSKALKIEQKETSTGKELTTENAIKRFLLQQLSEKKLDANYKELPSKSDKTTRFIPGLHALSGKTLPAHWKSVFSPTDLSKSSILPLIIESIIAVADFLPTEMKTSFDQDISRIKSTLIPDVTLINLGFDSQNIIAFRTHFIEKLQIALRANFNLPFFMGEIKSSITYKSLLEPMISPIELSKNTISQLAENITETLLIYPVLIGTAELKNTNSYISSSPSYSCFQINQNNLITHALDRSASDELSSNIAITSPANIVVIALSDITGNASWWQLLFNNIHPAINSESQGAAKKISYFTILVPFLPTSNVDTIKNALAEKCNSTIFNTNPDAQAYVVGYSSGGIFALLLKEAFPKKIKSVSLLDTIAPPLLFPMSAGSHHNNSSTSIMLPKPMLTAREKFCILLKDLSEVYRISQSDFEITHNKIKSIALTDSNQNTSPAQHTQTYIYWKKIIHTASMLLPANVRDKIKSLWEFLLILSHNSEKPCYTSNDPSITLLIATNTRTFFHPSSSAYTLGFHTDTQIESVNHGTTHKTVPKSQQVETHILNTLRSLFRPSSPTIKAHIIRQHGPSLWANKAGNQGPLGDHPKVTQQITQ